MQTDNVWMSLDSFKLCICELKCVDTAFSSKFERKLRLSSDR